MALQIAKRQCTLDRRDKLLLYLFINQVMIDRVAMSIHWVLYNSDRRLSLSLLATVNLYCRPASTCHWGTPIRKSLDVILFAAELSLGDRFI